MRKAFIALALVVIVAGPALAGGKPSVCTRGVPRASIDNTFAWASPGSWGTPGEQVRFAVNVFNYDIGCGSSVFAVTLSVADGFSVSAPSTVTVGSAASTHVWASITSPAGAADGDHPVSVTIHGDGTSSAPATSAYKG